MTSPTNQPVLRYIQPTITIGFDDREIPVAVLPEEIREIVRIIDDWTDQGMAIGSQLQSNQAAVTAAKNELRVLIEHWVTSLDEDSLPK